MLGQIYLNTDSVPVLFKDHYDFPYSCSQVSKLPLAHGEVHSQTNFEPQKRLYRLISERVHSCWVSWGMSGAFVFTLRSILVVNMAVHKYFYLYIKENPVLLC